MWKTLLAGASLAALFSFSAAQAAEKTVYLAGYGGSFEKTLKEQVLPAWEAKTGAKVVYAPGNSTDTLAKLRASGAYSEELIDALLAGLSDYRELPPAAHEQ